MNIHHHENKNCRRETAKIYKEYMKTSVIGLEVALSLVVGTAGGYFFDRYFTTEPWGIIVGALLGILAAGKRLYTFSRAYLKEHGTDINNHDIQ